MKRKIKTKRDRLIAEERKQAIEATRARRGSRVDFTKRKLNTRGTYEQLIGLPEREDKKKLRKIVKCSCGQKGILSGALLPSILIIHRGLIKDGKFRMSDYCVNSQTDFLER
jgi:hypothetical protein